MTGPGPLKPMTRLLQPALLPRGRRQTYYEPSAQAIA